MFAQFFEPIVETRAAALPAARSAFATLSQPPKISRCGEKLAHDGMGDLLDDSG